MELLDSKRSLLFGILLFCQELPLICAVLVLDFLKLGLELVHCLFHALLVLLELFLSLAVLLLQGLLVALLHLPQRLDMLGLELLHNRRLFVLGFGQFELQVLLLVLLGSCLAAP